MDPILLQEVKNQTDVLSDELESLWDEYCQTGYKHVVDLRLFKKYWMVMQGLLVSQPGALVLDAGCGIGSMFPLILQKIQAGRVIAVDCAGEMLQGARIMAGRLTNSRPNVFEFQQRDLTQPYPWLDNTFDAEVYSISLCYFPHRNWEQALGEAYRTIKAGGYIYTSIMLRGWDFPAMIKNEIPRELLANPVRCIKAAKVKSVARKLQAYIEEGVIVLSTREEFLEVLDHLGFKEIVQEEIFGGAGMAIRARKYSS